MYIFRYTEYFKDFSTYAVLVTTFTRTSVTPGNGRTIFSIIFVSLAQQIFNTLMRDIFTPVVGSGGGALRPPALPAFPAFPALPRRLGDRGESMGSIER